MQEADKLVAQVEFEMFGVTHAVEPTFELTFGFEQAFGSSILDPKHWLPTPKLSAVATLLWLAIGGRASGKSRDDVAKSVKRRHMVAAVKIADLVAAQCQESPEEKNGGAAE